MREDPEVECAVVRRFGLQNALVVGSGGCTAFALLHAHPGLSVTAFDINPAQRAHVQAKADAIEAGDLEALNVGSRDPSGLSQCGAFEDLFRVLASAIRELVVSEEEIEAWFGGVGDATTWFARPHWASVFHCAFNDAVLVAMFGPDAIQHAAPGSYPSYFQAAFERGLSRGDARHNPFLQHVLLGRYLPEHAPAFLTSGTRFDVKVLLGGLLDVPRLGAYDLVHLSNIFDWSDAREVAAWGSALQVLKPGAVITIRQLNNSRPVLPPGFRIEAALSQQLTQSDRSLFYERILVARREG